MEERLRRLLGVAFLLGACVLCANIVLQMRAGVIPFRLALLAGCIALLVAGGLVVAMCHWVLHIRRWTGFRLLRKQVDAADGGLSSAETKTLISLLGEESIRNDDLKVPATKEEVAALIDRCERSMSEHKRRLWRWFAISVAMTVLYVAAATIVHLLSRGPR